MAAESVPQGIATGGRDGDGAVDGMFPGNVDGDVGEGAALGIGEASDAVGGALEQGTVLGMRSREALQASRSKKTGPSAVRSPKLSPTARPTTTGGCIEPYTGQEWPGDKATTPSRHGPSATRPKYPRMFAARYSSSRPSRIHGSVHSWSQR